MKTISKVDKHQNTVEKAFAYVPLHDGLGIAVEGEKGYHPVFGNGKLGYDAYVTMAADKNKALGISQEDAEALEAGSMFGWRCPAAGRFRQV